MTANQERRAPAPSVVPQIVGVGLICFGLMMLVMVGAYTQDLSAFTSAPGAVWRFICGAPSRSPLLMPLMICLSLAAVVAGAVLLAWGGRIARLFQPSKRSHPHV